LSGLTLIFFGFIRDDPRPSALSAFYCRLLCRKHQLLTRTRNRELT